MNTRLIMTISVFITGATPTLTQVFHPTTGSGLERRAADVLEDQKFNKRNNFFRALVKPTPRQSFQPDKHNLFLKCRKNAL